MKLSPLLPVALVLAACGGLPQESETLAAAEPLAAEEQAIINGRACEEGEHLATVAILVEAYITSPWGSGNIKTVICTGTVIAPDTVIAAAHCVDKEILGQGMGDVKSATFYVSFQSDLSRLAGGHGGMFPSDVVKVRHHVMHPQFMLKPFVNGPSDFNDVALLFLDKQVSVKPELLVSTEEAQQIQPNKPVSIAGWGQQTVTSGYQQPPPGTVGKKMCAESFVGAMGPYEMQIGGGISTSRKCHGDSGGPTFMDVETSFENKRRLIGITSHAYDETDCQKGGVDTRVDAYVPWIDEQMRKACADGQRIWCEQEGILTPEYFEPPPPPPAEEEGAGGDEPGRKAGFFDCSAAGAGGLLTLLPLLLRRRRRA